MFSSPLRTFKTNEQHSNESTTKQELSLENNHSDDALNNEKISPDPSENASSANLPKQTISMQR